MLLPSDVKLSCEATLNSKVLNIFCYSVAGLVSVKKKKIIVSIIIM